MQSLSLAQPIRWLELAPGYACNCRCIGCHSCSMATEDQMPPQEVLHWLQRGRRMGAKHLWLSGGEPTLRKDCAAILRAARQLGYQRIKVQSNGMLFAYEAFAAKTVAAGMTEVNLLLKSLDAKVHDALNRTPGSHVLLNQAVDVLTRHAVRIEGDVLVTSRNVGELEALVRHYAERGVRHFNLWLFSLVDQGDADLRRLVPDMRALVPAMLAARTAAHAAGATLVSLNTPHCVVPPEAWDLQFDAARMRLLVVNPGGNVFALEDSSIERGAFVPACDGCAARPWCHGIRQDFLDVHGDGWISPVSADALSRGNPIGSILDA